MTYGHFVDKKIDVLKEFDGSKILIISKMLDDVGTLNLGST